MAPIVETNQETAITGFSNCIFGVAPFFVFRSSIKHSQHRPPTSACRLVVHHINGRLIRRCRCRQRIRGIVGCKRKCDFLETMAYQGPAKVRVASLHGVRESSRQGSSYLNTLVLDVYSVKLVVCGKFDVGLSLIRPGL